MNDGRGWVDLGDGAKGYIRSRTDSDDRRFATDYALMPDDEFRARIGPAVDEIDKKLDALINRLGPPSGGIVVRYATAFEDSLFVKLLTAAVVTVATVVGKKVSQ